MMLQDWSRAVSGTVKNSRSGAERRAADAKLTGAVRKFLTPSLHCKKGLNSAGSRQIRDLTLRSGTSVNRPDM